MIVRKDVMWHYARFDDQYGSARLERTGCLQFASIGRVANGALEMAVPPYQAVGARTNSVAFAVDEHCPWRDPSRRKEWSLSRVVAKRLILDAAVERPTSPQSIDIRSRDELGRGVRPVVTIDGRAALCSLSISHIKSAVIVAVCADPFVTVGVDLVQKAELGKGFLRAWFDEDEQSRIDPDDAEEICRLWAVKEAVYKAANQNDPFAPRRVRVRTGSAGEYRCTYRGVELGDRCRVTTWECGDQIAALAVVQRDRIRTCTPTSAATPRTLVAITRPETSMKGST
jgi:phosphopantetheinyl transferase